MVVARGQLSPVSVNHPTTGKLDLMPLEHQPLLPSNVIILFVAKIAVRLGRRGNMMVLGGG